jgi:CRISPR-associated protein Csb2
VRDAAAARLRAALGEAAAPDIQRCLIGKAEDGSGSVPLKQRVRILPLPSIGAAHADQAIRRVVVATPGGCPLSVEDLEWAFSGLQQVDPDTGELSPWMLTAADSHDMLSHYTRPSRYWQSVTPVALPQAASRRRIDPSRQREQAKGAAERQQEEARAIAAVRAALRHAGVSTPAAAISVRREPFNSLGLRAEASGAGTRFAKERLWHVALAFEQPVRGPMAIGDGRFLGLGMLAPSRAAQAGAAEPAAVLGVQSDGVFALQVLDPRAAGSADAVTMARALRRAVMACVLGTDIGSAPPGLARYVSGHVQSGAQEQADGAGRTTRPPGAADDDPCHHLAFQWDAPRGRWLVLAPHRLQRRPALRSERLHLAVVDQALDDLSVVLAGRMGRHAVKRTLLATADPLLAPARVWESVTPYTVTRHRRLSSAVAALVADVRAECGRCALPTPEVDVLAVRSSPGKGLQAQLRLRFASAVPGPMALGRTGLLGGGLFAAVADGADGYTT